MLPSGPGYWPCWAVILLSVGLADSVLGVQAQAPARYLLNGERCPLPFEVNGECSLSCPLPNPSLSYLVTRSFLLTRSSSSLISEKSLHGQEVGTRGYVTRFSR
jgi:hypothetical protein